MRNRTESITLLFAALNTPKGVWCKPAILWLWLGATCLFLLADSAVAQAVLRVKNDNGGNLPERIALVERMRAQNQSVEIRRGYCRSACTLYLGLPGTCVGPRSVFGFHGPTLSLYGVYLPPAEFEHWSNVMAAYYPPPLRQWFIGKARFRRNGYSYVSGAELIRLGVPSCPQ